MTARVHSEAAGAEVELAGLPVTAVNVAARVEAAFVAVAHVRVPERDVHVSRMVHVDVDIGGVATALAALVGGDVPIVARAGLVDRTHVELVVPRLELETALHGPAHGVAGVGSPGQDIPEMLEAAAGRVRGPASGDVVHAGQLPAVVAEGGEVEGGGSFDGRLSREVLFEVRDKAGQGGSLS